MLDFKRISALQKDHGIIAVATVVRSHGSTPRDVGSKMAVLASGRIEGTVGGGPLEKLVIEDALKLLENAKGFLYKEYKMVPKDEGGIGAECGGHVDVFIEVTGAVDHLLIMGGGHIGLVLCRMAREMDMQVTIVDDREEFATKQRFPDAEVVLSEYDDPGLRQKLKDESSVVILTHGHLHDADALKNILAANHRGYIGMIGSRRKVEAVRKQLLEEGVDQELLDGVYTPVGLDIGAETPAEIAVAILAEIVQVHRRGAPSPLGMGRKP